MAWIELHQEFRDHPKVARLAARLNVDYCLAQAYLINLWLWACSYARDGNLTKFSALEITEGAKSKVEASLFIQTLIELQWIDRAGDKIMLHDWKKYGLRILTSSKKRVAKFRKETRLRDHDVTLLKCNGTLYLSILSNLSIPSNHSILSNQFREAWDEWIDYRMQRKKPVTEISARQQLKFLSQQPDPIGCIGESIRNGWQGIFELKGNNGTHRRSNSEARPEVNADDLKRASEEIKRRHGR